MHFLMKANGYRNLCQEIKHFLAKRIFPVESRPSSLPDAGNGLFATKTIRKDEVGLCHRSVIQLVKSLPNMPAMFFPNE